MRSFKIAAVNFAIKCASCCMMMFLLGCLHTEQFKKDCDLCEQINQKEVQTALINFVYNDVSEHISKDAEIALNQEKNVLRSGHKFLECGCIGDQLVYHLWCADGSTYQLEVELNEPDKFIITGIQEAEFSHP